MPGLILGRLAAGALVLLLVSLASFALIGLMPGDPYDLMLAGDPSLTAADAARLKALQGLDRPLLARWWDWLGRALGGDLGHSRLYALPVRDLLLPRLGATLLLAGTGLLLALLLALPAGTLAAARPGGALDRAVGALSLAGWSVPSFWLALLLILLFAVELGWLPAGGPGEGGVRETLRHMALPVLALALGTAGGIVRFVRGAMLDALEGAHVRTARAKGCGPWGVLLRHAWPHAAPVILSLTALHVGAVLGGALVVETVFAWGGMGKLLYDAVMGNDYNLALAALLLATAVTLLANLAADMAQLGLDPRLREGAAGGAA